MRNVIVHHTVSDPHTSVAAIRRYHQNVRGFRDIGYHFVIVQNADETWTACPGRPVSEIGAHCLGQNQHVGIAFGGDWRFPDKIKNNQGAIECFHALVDQLRKNGTVTGSIHAHREYAKTECPGQLPVLLGLQS